MERLQSTSHAEKAQRTSRKETIKNEELPLTPWAANIQSGDNYRTVLSLSSACYPFTEQIHSFLNCSLITCKHLHYLHFGTQEKKSDEQQSVHEISHHHQQICIFWLFYKGEAHFLPFPPLSPQFSPSVVSFPHPSAPPAADKSFHRRAFTLTRAAGRLEDAHFLSTTS